MKSSLTVPKNQSPLWAPASLLRSASRAWKPWALALLIGFGPGAGFQLSAQAASEKEVTWSDMSSIDLATVLRTQYASSFNLLNPVIPESSIELVLNDADSRIAKDFRIPSALRAPTEFWLRIYTLYTTEHVVIFDGKHPEIVYDVLDFRQLARTARNRAAYEITARIRTANAVASLKKALQHLTKTRKPKHPTAWELKVIAAVRKTKHRHPYKELALNLRTQLGQRDNVIKGLLGAEAFFPKMEQLFISMSVPPELTRLALVESSFNLNAVSRAGASGVWQFMRRSALEYMTVDERRGIDERLSPLKATVAAAKLLKRNKRILGSWLLATISYNHGTRDLRSLSSVDPEGRDVKRMFNPCHVSKSKLGFASRNYYAEFLAVLHAEAYRHIFFGDVPRLNKKAIAMEQLKRAQTGQSFARARGIPLQHFKFLNPDILDLSKRLPVGFTIAVPGESDDLAALLPQKKVKRSTSG